MLSSLNTRVFLVVVSGEGVLSFQRHGTFSGTRDNFEQEDTNMAGTPCIWRGSRGSSAFEAL